MNREKQVEVELDTVTEVPEPGAEGGDYVIGPTTPPKKRPSAGDGGSSLAEGWRIQSIPAAMYKYGLITVFALMVMFFAITMPAFLSLQNLFVIIESVAIVSVAALGVTASLAVGGWDLSIGGNMSFTVMVVATIMVRFNWGPAAGIVGGLLAGLFVGVINSALIVKGKIPDLIATLGTMFVFEGLALVITGGNSVATGMTLANGQGASGHFGSIFHWLGNGSIIFGIPVLVLVFVITGVIFTIFLERTRQGRAMYAVGLNREATRLAGIQVERFRAMAYILSGLLGGMAGVMLAAQLGEGQVNAGSPYLLECVAAALIAYAFLGLKRPSAYGTIFGALFVGVVINGLTMLNVPYYVEGMTRGILLIFALLLTFTVTVGKPKVKEVSAKGSKLGNSSSGWQRNR